MGVGEAPAGNGLRPCAAFPKNGPGTDTQVGFGAVRFHRAGCRRLPQKMRAAAGRSGAAAVRLSGLRRSCLYFCGGIGSFGEGRSVFVLRVLPTGFRNDRRIETAFAFRPSAFGDSAGRVPFRTALSGSAVRLRTAAQGRLRRSCRNQFSRSNVCRSYQAPSSSRPDLLSASSVPVARSTRYASVSPSP